jgi:hypothetical protein
MNMKALLQPATKKARPLCSQRGGVRQHPDSSAGATLHFAPASGKSKCGCSKLPSIATWIVVVPGLVEKVNNNQTSVFW